MLMIVIKNNVNSLNVHGFDSRHLHCAHLALSPPAPTLSEPYADLAQLVEQRFCKP